MVDLEAILLSSAQSDSTDTAFVDRGNRIFTATFLTSLRKANFADLLLFEVFLKIHAYRIMDGQHFFCTCRFIKQRFCDMLCIFLVISIKARSSSCYEYWIAKIYVTYFAFVTNKINFSFGFGVFIAIHAHSSLSSIHKNMHWMLRRNLSWTVFMFFILVFSIFALDIIRLCCFILGLTSFVLCLSCCCPRWWVIPMSYLSLYFNLLFLRKVLKS